MVVLRARIYPRRLLLVRTVSRHPRILDPVMVAYELPITSQQMLIMVAPHARVLPRSLNHAMIVGLSVARSVNAMVHLGRPHSSHMRRQMAALNVLLKRSLLSPAHTALPRVNLPVIVMAP